MKNKKRTSNHFQNLLIPQEKLFNFLEKPSKHMKWNHSGYFFTSTFLTYVWMVLILSALLSIPRCSGAEDLMDSFSMWENEVTLEQRRRFVVQWTPTDNRIIFRITAKTRGYIGFGFHTKPQMHGSDIVVGWVHSGKIYLQDRHGENNEEPAVDLRQDWDLIGGFQNDTHTSLTMARPFSTCDEHDYQISNDTVKLLWAYHPDDPVDPESPKPRLHYHGTTRRGVATLFLLQRARPRPPSNSGILRLNKPKKINFDGGQKSASDPHVHSWSLVGPEATIEPSVDSVHWCRMFMRPRLTRKHHIIKYEPVLVGEGRSHVHHMMLYECVRMPPENEAFLARMTKKPGGVCNQKELRVLMSACNHVVVAWAMGSEGVWLPPEAGYPLVPEGPMFYMLETHYNVSHSSHLNDSSGVRLLHTPFLRNYDAGVLSVGLHPNWKHIIPPRQPSVVSEGHCVAECTHAAFPSTGINVFGVISHTHLLGRRVRLRHIRGDKELEPIVRDSNYDFTYQEYRGLSSTRNVLPGDHLISECVYNSESCSSITLGGFKTREEMCLSFVFYYPKVELSFCHSKPSLSTVLLSLGIQELSDNSQPITIKLPAELAGKTLKWRLQNYDWENHFNHFQGATHNGTFDVMCRGRGHNLIPELESDHGYPKVKEWKAPSPCQSTESFAQTKGGGKPSETALGSGSTAPEDPSWDANGETRLIERLDVSPVNDFDVFMPVIGVEDEEDEDDLILSPDVNEDVGAPDWPRDDGGIAVPDDSKEVPHQNAGRGTIGTSESHASSLAPCQALRFFLPLLILALWSPYFGHR